MAEKDTEYLNSNEPFRRVNLIGGAYATVDTPSLVGYCHNDDHKGFLTVAIMNEHDCIAKECHYFEKFEDYPYWQKFRRKEELSKLKKAKRQRQKENEQRHADKIKRRDEAIIARANKVADELGIHNFRLVSIHKSDKGFTVFYISDNPVNDWYNFREIAFALNRAFHQKFTLKHIKLLDGSYAVI